MLAENLTDAKHAFPATNPASTPDDILGGREAPSLRSKPNVLLKSLRKACSFVSLGGNTFSKAEAACIKPFPLATLYWVMGQMDVGPDGIDELPLLDLIENPFWNLLAAFKSESP